MSIDLQRTIVALSSPLAPARRAILRISGPDTGSILDSLLPADADPVLRRELLGARSPCMRSLPLLIGWGTRTIDAAIYYWPNARSYTGQPSAELHLLGSMPLVEQLCEQVCRAGAAAAQRGEFTLRSFLAGKLDLTQAEAVLGVIEADSDEQLNAALRQLGGNISGPVKNLRRQLLTLIAHLEAGLDFVEEDIEFISNDDLLRDLTQIRNELASLSSQLNLRGTRNRHPRVALVGHPNAGKSSLFNALVGFGRSIVSDQPGTTRDAISLNVDLNGLVVELVDTAGLEVWQNTSPRAEAQRALHARLQQFDLLLWCFDLSAADTSQFDSSISEPVQHLNLPTIEVGTKRDRVTTAAPGDRRENASSNHCSTSVYEPKTIELLVGVLKQHLGKDRDEFQSEAMHRTMVRCRHGIDQSVESIDRALQLVRDGAMVEELVAAELRLALDDLSAVIGEVHTEDILGEIFSRFCIGK